MVYVLDDTDFKVYDEFIDKNSSHIVNGPVYTIELTGWQPGLQGVDGNHILFDFNEVGCLEFQHVFGGSITDLDASLESVVDTGDSIIFQFSGGGTLTIDGVSGYEDFTALSMDYTVLVTD